MTKTFCDICGKELSTLEQINTYNVVITGNNRTLRAPHARNYPEVCEDCAKGIVNIIDAIKEQTNG